MRDIQVIGDTLTRISERVGKIAKVNKTIKRVESQAEPATASPAPAVLQRAPLPLIKSKG